MEPTSTDTVQWMLEHAPDYLESREFRRAELEASLWKPELPYARKRLTAYGLERGGWDLLPEFEVKVTTVGENPTEIELSSDVPQTREEWLALGEQVFWYAPMRRDGYLLWLSERPELWDELGLQADADGNIRGVVRYTDPLGDQRTAITCGACHGDQGIAGAANKNLDLGRARAIFGEENGLDNTLFGTWGPGTVDVTDDGVTDPLAIPNLWNLDTQTHINHSAAIKLDSPAALAIRFETQYIEGQSLLRRPNRVIPWALAMYVYSLKPGTRPDTSLPGHTTFEQKCGSCHQADKAFGGGLIPADSINADPLASNSPLRGTGYYKVPTLLGISNSDRFMNNAKVDSLEDVIDSGHPYGETMSENDKVEILEFLNTL